MSIIKSDLLKLFFLSSIQCISLRIIYINVKILICLSLAKIALSVLDSHKILTLQVPVKTSVVEAHFMLQVYFVKCIKIFLNIHIQHEFIRNVTEHYQILKRAKF